MSAPPDPDALARGLVGLCRAWVAVDGWGLEPMNAEEHGGGATSEEMTTAAAYLVSLADSPEIAALASSLRGEGGFAVALANFADTANAALSLDADAFDVAIAAAFRNFVAAVRPAAPQVGP